LSKKKKRLPLRCLRIGYAEAKEGEGEGVKTEAKQSKLCLQGHLFKMANPTRLQIFNYKLL
jgi:hypothetical protein